jgi:hypothetical protein
MNMFAPLCTYSYATSVQGRSNRAAAVASYRRDFRGGCGRQRSMRILVRDPAVRGRQVMCRPSALIMVRSFGRIS